LTSKNFSTNYNPLRKLLQQEPLASEKTETYPCKFNNPQDPCQKFDSKKVCCLHGGGVGCKTWRRKTNLEIGPRALPGDANY
jgi:hypothetical protein